MVNNYSPNLVMTFPMKSINNYWPTLSTRGIGIAGQKLHRLKTH